VHAQVLFNRLFCSKDVPGLVESPKENFWEFIGWMPFLTHRTNIIKTLLGKDLHTVHRNLHNLAATVTRGKTVTVTPRSSIY